MKDFRFGGLGSAVALAALFLLGPQFAAPPPETAPAWLTTRGGAETGTVWMAGFYAAAADDPKAPAPAADSAPAADPAPAAAPGAAPTPTQTPSPAAPATPDAPAKSDDDASAAKATEPTPADLLAMLYGNYLDDPPFSAFDASERGKYFSPRVLKVLAGLDRAAATSAGEGIIGRLGFDPVLDGTSDDLQDLVLSEPKIVGGTAMGIVSFSVDGQPSEMVFSFVKVDGKWRIDDIERISDISPWRLNSLLSSDG